MNDIQREPLKPNSNAGQQTGKGRGNGFPKKQNAQGSPLLDRTEKSGSISLSGEESDLTLLQARFATLDVKLSKNESLLKETNSRLTEAQNALVTMEQMNRELLEKNRLLNTELEIVSSELKRATDSKKASGLELREGQLIDTSLDAGTIYFSYLYIRSKLAKMDENEIEDVVHFISTRERNRVRAKHGIEPKGESDI